MKAAAVGLLIGVLMVSTSALSWAAQQPLVFTHTLTAFTAGADGVTVLDYVLHVENRGEMALTNVSLSSVPLPPFVGVRKQVDVGSLDPHEKADIPVTLTATRDLKRADAARARLLWAGKAHDSAGTMLEFPVACEPGGKP